MSHDETKSTLEFEIKSLDPTKKTIDIVPEIEKLSEEVQLAVARKYPGATVRIRRREGMPAHLVIQYLLLHIDWHAVAAGAEKAAAAFATTEFLLLMKRRFANVFTKQAEAKEPEVEAGDASTESGSSKSAPPKESAHESSSKKKSMPSSKPKK
jgi:hypothetical protein